MKDYISQSSLEDKQLTEFTNEVLNAPARYERLIYNGSVLLILILSSSFDVSLNPNDTIIVMNKTDIFSPVRKIPSVQVN